MTELAISQSAHHDRDEAVLAYMPQVRTIARRIQKGLPQHVEVEELVSAGVIGLLDAFSKFDSTKQAHFKTYASWRIKGSIFDYMRSGDWAPRALRRKARAVSEARLAVAKRLESTPAEEDVAVELGISLLDYQRLVRDLRELEIGSLNAARTEDGDDEEICYLAGPESSNPLVRILAGERKQQVIDAMGTLPERWELVLRCYYYGEMTMAEIADHLDIGEPRVSQIHRAALNALCQELKDFAGQRRNV